MTFSKGRLNREKKEYEKKNFKCPKSNFIRVYLKESFHREKKD
jgi:hypothetical protein